MRHEDVTTELRRWITLAAEATVVPMQVAC